MDRPVRVYTLDQEFMRAHTSSQPAVDLVTCIIFTDYLEAISLATNLRAIVTFDGKARQVYSAIITPWNTASSSGAHNIIAEMIPQ